MISRMRGVARVIVGVLLVIAVLYSIAVIGLLVGTGDLTPIDTAAVAGR